MIGDCPNHGAPEWDCPLSEIILLDSLCCFNL